LIRRIVRSPFWRFTNLKTQREFIRADDPFFHRLGKIRSMFDQFEREDEELGGRLQDVAVESRLPGRSVDAEGWHNAACERDEHHALHRLSQIVLLYTTFEELCRTLDNKPCDLDAGHGPGVVQKAKKRHKSGASFLLAVLDEMSNTGMQSSVWPDREADIRLFVMLRNHLVHRSLLVTDGLLNKKDADGWTFCKALDNASSFPGETLDAQDNASSFTGKTLDKKFLVLGNKNWFVNLPSQFMKNLFDLIEQLAVEILVPNDYPIGLPGSQGDCSGSA